MNIKSIAANQTEVVLANGTTVFVSYKTPVACHVPGKGFFKTAQKWSVTTSKHITQFIARHGGSGKVEEKPQAWFDALA